MIKMTVDLLLDIPSELVNMATIEDMASRGELIIKEYIEDVSNSSDHRYVFRIVKEEKK